SMNDRKPAFAQLGLGAVLAAAVLALVGSRPGDSGKGSDKGEADKTGAPWSATHIAGKEPHRHFVRWYFDLLQGAPADQLGPYAPSAPLPHFSPEETKETKTLIVTVPDPVDTSFGFWFDEMVESLTLAAGYVDYVPVAHWYPWMPTGGG